jgi:hypothetical protein
MITAIIFLEFQVLDTVVLESYMLQLVLNSL